MKATQITLVLLLAFLSYPCHSQFAPESLGDALSKDIVNRERLAWEAAKNKDKAGLAALLSEDFTEITEPFSFSVPSVISVADCSCLSGPIISDNTSRTPMPRPS